MINLSKARSSAVVVEPLRQVTSSPVHRRTNSVEVKEVSSSSSESSSFRDSDSYGPDGSNNQKNASGNQKPPEIQIGPIAPQSPAEARESKDASMVKSDAKEKETLQIKH